MYIHAIIFPYMIKVKKFAIICEICGLFLTKVLPQITRIYADKGDNWFLVINCINLKNKGPILKAFGVEPVSLYLLYKPGLLFFSRESHKRDACGS